MKKRAKTKLPKDVCLHCAFFKMHQDKWPDWRPDGGNVDQKAFDDLVYSVIRIVAELFTMLDLVDRVKFLRNVLTAHRKLEPDDNPVSAKDLMEALKLGMFGGEIGKGGPTKH
jgi:hypothetical protein